MKRIAIFTITLLMLISIGITFVNKADAVKQKPTAHKERVKTDNDRETNDDCDKCEQNSKTEKVSKEDCEENCQQDKEDSDHEQGDTDNDEGSDRD